MAKTHPPDFIKRCKAILASKGFFTGIVAMLVIQAVWIALSGRYPMAFDENYHLGIIRLYADHLSPFWQAQPPGGDVLGAVFRDPSYLYHYLMSFPYRLIAVFSDSQMTHGLWLRFINIALFATSLPLYWRLLLKTGASRAIVNSCLTIFVLLPIVPLLAAQINYDNLMLPLTALVLLLAANFSEELRRTKRINLRKLIELTIVGLLACLVKYAFLPIMLVIGVYLIICLWRTHGRSGKFWLSVGFGWTLIGKWTRWALVIVLLLSIGLFTERYGVNLVRYHKPVPDCAAVLSVRQCEAYGPWQRDHYLELTKPSDATSNPLTFTADWFYGMWMRMFFAVDGPGSNFATKGPFILPGIGAIVFASAALVATLAAFPRVFRRYNAPVLWLFIVVAAGYAGVLWLDGYQSFLQTGQAVAINGRYLLPVIPLAVIILALGVNTLLGRRENLKLAFGGLAIICLLWGGGALTYILRSNPVWYWPNSPLTGVNKAIQRDVGPLVPGYYSPNEFMGRN